MSGRLGQLWCHHHGFDPLYMAREPQTLYYVVASSKNHYHMLDLDTGKFTSFKKSRFDVQSFKPSLYNMKTLTWQRCWERIA